MRELTSHKVNGCNEAIKVTVLDEPGSGGACHHYRLEFDNKKFGPDPQSMRQVNEVYFQNGPIAEVGTNGITHEALLAILIDRLDGFQSGPYACDANKFALEALELAQAYLKSRTLDRIARGVEGTHEK